MAGLLMWWVRGCSLDSAAPRSKRRALDSLFAMLNNACMATQKIESLWAHVHWLGMLSTTGSFTAAAQRLAVSKAAMSQRIAELERAAGVPLVRRTTRSVRLTEAGQQLVDSTRGAFEAIERSFAGVKDLAAAPRGLLRVTAGVALGRQQIVPRLAAFLREHPEVRIELELSDRLSSLAQEGFDLAIRHTASAPDTHVAWTLCETRSLLVASRAYLRRHGTPHAPAELARHNCLYYLRAGATPTWSFEPVEQCASTGARPRGRRPAPPAGEPPLQTQSQPRGAGAASANPALASSARISVPVAGSFAANNSEALREAALGGLGLAVLPDFSAQADMASGRLVPVLPAWRPSGAFGPRLYAIRPYSPYVPRAVQVFVEYLRHALKGGFS
jgi:DNA-binding transcriptional LysR family regulator